MMADLSRFRSDFPMLSQTMHGKPLIYLDTAATAQKPQFVIDTIQSFYQKQYGTVHRAIYVLSIFATQRYQEIRANIAAFINARSPEEIIYTRGSTESINMIAYSFGKAFISPGDEILITEMEHHSNLVPWQIACEDRGAILKVLPMNEKGELEIDQLKILLTPRTKIVAITHIANSIGTINPIKEIAHIVHHHSNAKILVDGAQGGTHLPVDVQDLDVDFYVFSGHKLYGPTGIGILYGRKELLDAMPPYQGGGDMINSVTFEKTTYAALPMKFEAGTPMIAEVMGIGAAVDYVKQVGMENIARWESELLHYATQKMQQIPRLKIIGTAKEKGGIISFIIDGTHPLDVGTMLDLRGIAVRTGHHCAQPTMRHFGVTATTRASFGLYNTKQDVDVFIDALKEIIKLLT